MGDTQLVKALKAKSAKVSALLAAVKALPKDEKVVVFSQFTRFLDIIERSLNSAGFPTLRIDGRHAAKKRFDAIRDFQKDGTARVFLVSLKAGGVGLNLTRGN